MLTPRRVIVPLLLAVMGSALSACLERKQTGVLNPDGSGKITMETFVAVPPAEPGAPPPPDALTYARQVATQIVQTSRGIDAWKDVSYDKAADGRAHVVGTCYFPDINKLQLDNPIPFSWTRDAAGNYTLSLKAESGQTPPGQPAMTDAQVVAAVSQGKAQYGEFRPMLQTTLAPLKVNASLTLPGKIAKSNVFDVSGGNTVSLAFDGKQVLGAMDKIMADDKALGDAIRAGRQPDADQNLLLEQIFGKKGPVAVTVSGANAPQFDYRAEVAAAKSGEAGMYRRLGIDPTPPAPQQTPGPAQGGNVPGQGAPLQR
jgi:hypothetical protein